MAHGMRLPQDAPDSPAGPRRTSPTAQFEELHFRRREYPNRHTHDADPAAHVQLAAPSLKVPHHVLGDHAPGRPADQRQVELAAVDVPRQREWDAPWHSRVPGAGTVREQYLERV